MEVDLRGTAAAAGGGGGRLKTRELKTQDWKTWDRIAGV